jgi:hypothetical protein
MVEHGKPPIAAEELKRRGEALDNAVAVNRLEGLRASPEVQVIHALWAQDQRTNEERYARVQAIFAAELASSDEDRAP